jgi:hypothetical protein
LGRRLRRFLERRFYAIIKINRRYATPRIKMTPMVRFALLTLRLYLLLLVGLLVYKFVTLLK